MTRLGLASALASCLLMSATPAYASSDVHLSGGGTATISQVAFNVAFDGSGAASGSFDCLMAGRSGFVLGAFGLSHLMKVQAHPTSGSVTGSLARFSGPGFLIMDGDKMQPIQVRVWADAATQQFQLTVVGVGAMPVETMTSGHFEAR